MTKDELRKELKTGVKLEDIFEFTDGQDCLIYKGKFLPGNIAEDLFNYVDWQTPDINDFTKGYDDKEQFFKEYRFPMDDLFVTEEMKDLLSRVADLAAQASDKVYDDDDDNGTYGILSLCDQLYEKINRYWERDSDD